MHFIARAPPVPKQSLEKSAVILGPIFGALLQSCPIALTFFHFKTGADKLVNLIWDDQMTFGKLSINVIAGIGVPNEAYDL